MTELKSKRCTVCCQDLPLSEFHRAKKGYLGHVARCKTCARRYHQQRKAALMAANPSHGLCQCGCGRPAPAGTNKDGGAILFIRGHQNRQVDKGNLKANCVTEDRGYDTPCWIWTGALTEFGYGAMHTPKGVSKFVHRHSYEHAYGSIPRGLVIDHLCRQAACINPEHLEAVSQGENCRRGNQTKLTKEIADEIRHIHATTSLGYKRIARAYGVHHSSIRDIILGKRWP